MANYRQVAEAFPNVEVTLLDDSGPVFYDDDLLPVALQELWQTTWDISEALPPGSEGEDVLEDIYDYIATTYSDASLGFLSYERDATIRFFYSFGQALTDPLCAQTLYGGLLMTPPQRIACIDGDTYEDALYEFRDQLPGSWKTFYTSVPNPLLHLFLRAERFYVATADGQNLSDWITDLIDGTAQDRGSRPVP